MHDPAPHVLARLLAQLDTLRDAAAGELTAASELAALDLDSLDLVETALELEALLDQPPDTAALAAARTVGELAACFAVPAHLMRL